jgi:hypothetical protein
VLGAEDAEDACQEVWVRLWLNIGRFRGDKRLRHVALQGRHQHVPRFASDPATPA